MSDEQQARTQGRGPRARRGLDSRSSPGPCTPDPVPLIVSDVKQYPYCPRIVYYSYLMPLRARPATYKMAEGKLEHERIEELEERRSLRAYGLKEGVRRFDVSLSSERLGLRGRLDMVIETARETIPVDFKNSEGKVGLNHKYQLTAYAMLVEEAFPEGQGSGVKGQGEGSGYRAQGSGGIGGSALAPPPSPLRPTLDSRPWTLSPGLWTLGRPVRRGFIYMVPQKRAYEVVITSNLRGWVKKALRGIREMLAKEMAPEPTRIRARCTDCEFRNLCPEVW